MPRTINRFFVAVSATTALLLTPVTAFAATRGSDGGTSGTDSAGQTYDDGTQSWPSDNGDGADTGDGTDTRGAWYIIDVPGTTPQGGTDADATRSADPDIPVTQDGKSPTDGTGTGTGHHGKHTKKGHRHPSGKKSSSKGHKHRKGHGRKHAKKKHPVTTATLDTTNDGPFHGTATQ